MKLDEAQNKTSQLGLATQQVYISTSKFKRKEFIPKSFNFYFRLMRASYCTFTYSLKERNLSLKVLIFTFVS